MRTEAQEDGSAAAEQLRAAERGRVERRVPELEQQPLLRIHGLRLCGRDAERTRIEAAGACHEAAVAHARALTRAQRAHVHHPLERPPRRGGLAHGIAARPKHRPPAAGRLAATGPSRCAAQKHERRAGTAPIAASRPRLGPLCRALGATRQLLEQVLRERARRRLLKEHGG